MKANGFDEWLDRYIEEKGINLDEPFSLEVDGIGHLFDYASIIEQMKHTSKSEQEKIRNKIKWSSNRKNVVTVSKKGIITAKNVGNAKITAKYKKEMYLELKIIV